jgi:hypothetical protein
MAALQTRILPTLGVLDHCLPDQPQHGIRPNQPKGNQHHFPLQQKAQTVSNKQRWPREDDPFSGVDQLSQGRPGELCSVLICVQVEEY